MKKPEICAVITDSDLAPIKEVAPLVQLFEVRIDLIGGDWEGVAGQLELPWLATNRQSSEGGSWRGSEEARIEELLKASRLGAAIVDIESATENLSLTVARIKQRSKCLISYHNLTGTPSPAELKATVCREQKAGADICKVVTTAQTVEDNLTVLQLMAEFPRTKLVSFAMGPLGTVSRVLCPLAGGAFTYASIAAGKESAPGQLTVKALRQIYEMIR